MNKITRLILAIALLAAGYWLYSVFFPSDQAVIRKLLDEAARKSSIRAEETGLSNYANARWLMNACTEQVKVTLDAPGIRSRSIQGREKLGQALGAIRATSGSLTIELIDVGIEVADNRATATAQFIARARIDSSPDPIVQELRITLQRVEGDWKFHIIEPLSSLTL